MLGGMSNPSVNEQNQAIPYFPRARQYYLSLDIDFNRIPVKNKALKSVLKVVNLVKVPFPGLEYHTVDGFKWNWLAY